MVRLADQGSPSDRPPLMEGSLRCNHPCCYVASFEQLFAHITKKGLLTEVRDSPVTLSLSRSISRSRVAATRAI